MLERKRLSVPLYVHFCLVTSLFSKAAGSVVLLSLTAMGTALGLTPALHSTWSNPSITQHLV